jgi:aspartate aminotransferase-like enzyme
MEDERTPRFAARFTGVVRKLQQVYRTSNQILVFTSSTTGAFESVVQNLFSPGERVLVASNGSFGERWVHMCRAFGLEVVELAAPWTPAIGALTQLEAALDLLLDEGLEARVHRHIVLGRIARAGLRGMGLELVTPARERNAMLTAAYVPAAIDSEELVRQLADSYGVQIVGCTGPLAGRAIRLGHGGFVDCLDVIVGIAAIELTLHSMGASTEIGSGPAAALRELSRLMAKAPAVSAPALAASPEASRSGDR